MLHRCYVCHQIIKREITWTSLFLPELPKKLCQRCQSQIKELSSPTCPRCSRPSSWEEICLDCRHWDKYFNQKDPLNFNISLLTYNHFLREIVSTWKYRGDYVIIEIFQEAFVHQYHKSFSEIKNPILVPIPLSEERARERGFNQAEQLAKWLPGKVVHAFSRVTSEKQAKKSRLERIRGKNPFHLHKKINQPVILVDDLYTTGSTLRQAATLLRKQACPAVYAYTLIRG